MRVIRGVADTLRVRGVDLGRLVNGLSFTIGDLTDGARRVPWDDYTIFLERAEAALGGSMDLEEVCGEMLVRHRAAYLLAGLLVRPQDVYQLATRACRAWFRILAMRLDILPDGLLRMEATIPHEYRDCQAFFRASTGVLRVYPRLVGAPDALVQAEISPRRAVHYIRPPPSETLASRLARRLDRSLSAVLEVLPGRPEATVADMDEALGMTEDGPAVEQIAASVGPTLAAQPSLDDLGREVLDKLGEYLCSHRAALWVRASPGAPLVRVASLTPTESMPTSVSCAFPLSVGDAEVGRLDLDLPSGNREEQRRIVLALLPWIALGVLRGVDSRKPSADPWGRMRARSQVWRLTTQESRVLELLLQGLSNKEIASALGCSPRTVEIHVSRVLRKSGHESRAALIARG